MSKATHITIPLSDVHIDPELNNRTTMDTEEEISELAAQIESTDGLLQPIIVYAATPERQALHGKHYELVAGNRRCAALQYLAEKNEDDSWITLVSASLREGSLAERALDQLIENIGRKNLSPIETALALKKALDDPANGFNQTELARRVGLPVPTVSNYLKVTRLCSEVIDLIIDGKLGWAQAKELSSVQPKLNGDLELEKQLAEMAVGMSYDDFKDHLDRTFRSDGTEKDDKEEGEVSTGKKSDQKTPQAIRTRDLSEKYIPHLQQLRDNESDPKKKEELDIRLDTMKFCLKTEGTKLGESLADWEEELLKQAEEEKAEKDALRNENTFIRKAVGSMKKELKKTPPATIQQKNPSTGEMEVVPNPNREMATVESVLKQLTATIKKKVADAEKEGLFEEVTNEDGTKTVRKMVADGFEIPDVDALVAKIHEAYNADVAAEAARKEKREKEKAAREAAEAESGAKAENAKAEETATATA